MPEEPLHKELEKITEALDERVRDSRLISETATERVSQPEAGSDRLDIFEKAAAGICVCHDTPEAPFVRFTYWNPRMTQITGYTMEEINRIGWYQSMYPDLETRQRAMERMSRMRAGEDIHAEEWCMTTRCGKPSYLSISTSVLKEENGQTHVLAVMQDISERKKTEQALRKNEARFRDILDRVENIPVQGYDAARVVTYWNIASEKVYGYTKEEALGHKLEDLIIPAEMRRKVIADIDGWVNAGRQIPAGELVLCDKDGKPLHVYSSHVMHQGVSGDKEMFCIDLDLRQLRRTEKAQRESEQRYRSLVENTMDGYFICEIPSGQFVFLNQRACEMFGYSKQEGLSLSVWDVIAEGDHSHILQRIQDRIAGKDMPSERQTYTAVCKDGSTFRAEISTSLVTHSRQIAVQGILRDVTENERLQRQLQQAQKFEAIGTLAGGIAHDFNNLLMGIQGRASLMAADMDFFHSQKEHIEAIEDYVRSATHLTKQLLGFARGGKYEIKPIDLNDLVASGAAMFGRTRKDIRIHLRTLPERLVIEADRPQIEQVLLNLFVNAWQAMPDGGELYIETSTDRLDEAAAVSHRLRPGSYARILVRDTGVGMEESVLHRVFDPFFTTKEKSRGTGLGLASAYGIVKNHGGIISVHSKIGQGATFTVYLPVSDKRPQTEEPEQAVLLSGSGVVLLVDDEEIIIDVGSAMLEKMGYRVLVANSGETAVDAVHKRGSTIDLVILDLIMPGLDGGKTFDRIRALRPELPVILSSGYAIDGKVADILRRGCNGFIQKPFNMMELSKKVRQILDKVRGDGGQTAGRRTPR